MGFLDRLLGRDDSQQTSQPAPRQAQPATGSAGPRRSDDEIALERYRYLLRTAPPEKLEEVHAEAFAKLTPEQRRQVYADLAKTGETPAGDDAGSLARSATRAEVANPGTMERAFGGRGQGGPSFGSMVGSSLLGTVAGYVIGSALVSAFLPGPDLGEQAGGAEDGAAGDGGAEDGGADGFGGNDAAGADAGGDAGGWGDGGFGGGDFGGGDFGGGDFGGGFDV